jgi:hypothetical protein
MNYVSIIKRNKNFVQKSIQEKSLWQASEVFSQNSTFRKTNNLS